MNSFEKERKGGRKRYWIKDILGGRFRKGRKFIKGKGNECRMGGEKIKVEKDEKE